MKQMIASTPRREYTVRMWRHVCGFVVTLAGHRMDRPNFCPYCRKRAIAEDFEELIDP
jgi:hypothetical protein